MGMLISEVACLAGVIALIALAFHISHRQGPADYLQQAARCEAQARERDLVGDHERARRAREEAERNRRRARS